MKNKKKHIPGQVFAIPLNDFYIIGLIIRSNNDILLGHFFKQKFNNIPAVNDVHAAAENVVLIKIFSGLGLDKKKWIILGSLPGFSIEEWKMPVFKRKDLISGEYYKVFYNDKLEEIKTEFLDSYEDLALYPDDGTAGYGFIEKRLLKLLNP